MKTKNRNQTTARLASNFSTDTPSAKQKNLQAIFCRDNPATIQMMKFI